MLVDPNFGVLDMASLLVLSVVCLISLALCVLQLVATWKVNVKLGKPGWGSLIPIYSSWCLAEPVAGSNMAWALVGCQVAYMVFACFGRLAALAACCSIAAFVLSIVVSNKLSHHFGHGTWFTVGLVCLPVIFMSILAFEHNTVLPPVDDGNSEK